MYTLFVRRTYCRYVHVTGTRTNYALQLIVFVLFHKPGVTKGSFSSIISVPKFRNPGDRAVTYGNFDSKLHEVSLSYAKLRFN
jgi:hypothetical protein